MTTLELFSPGASKALTAVNSMRACKIPALAISGCFDAAKSWPFMFQRYFTKRMYRLGLGCFFSRYSSALSFYSASRDSRLYSGYNSTDTFVNFGSGGFYHPRWKLFDYPGESAYYKRVQGVQGVDYLPIDLCAESLRLPFDASSVSAIYLSHTLEHLQLDRALLFLAECSRILKNNGILRLALPRTAFDFSRASIICESIYVSQAYKKEFARQVAFHVFSPSVGLLPENHDFLTDLRDVDYVASRFVDLMKSKYGLSGVFNPQDPGWHLSEWNDRLLSSLSNDLGMSLYVPCFRGQTFCPPMSNIHVFDTTEPQITMYGEFIK